MPWWDNSIWLPLDVPHAGAIKDDSGTFVGSSAAFLKELVEIQRRSPLGLGAKPPGYEQMLKDIAAFYNDAEFRLDDDDTIRWIWRALRDGAEISVNSHAILWCDPD